MLHFTGHPLVDVGVAVITNHFKTDDPKEITDEQLNQFAQYLEEVYSTPFFHKFLFVLFPNSAYVNPTMKEENRRKELDRVLYGFLQKEQEQEKTFQCVFCGHPTTFKAYRQHIPLITGEGLINFFPSHRVGVETCPYCLLAIQAFPLGSLKVSGQAFFVHSENPKTILFFVKKFTKINNKNRLLTDEKEGITGKFAKTLFIDQLIEVDENLDKEKMMGNDSGSVTIYHLTNYGTKADINMFHLPLLVLKIIYKLNSSIYKYTWQQMKVDGWRYKKENEDEDNYNAYENMNELYENLFDLPHLIYKFIQRHTLGGMMKRFKALQDGLPKKEGLDYWGVTKIILEDLVQMKSERVEKTRELAEKLVVYLLKTNDKKFFRQFYFSSSRNRSYAYEDLRNLILKINMRVLNDSKNGNKLMDTVPITYDDFIEVFEEWDDIYNGNWRLARDLILLRIMERLYQEDWFVKNKDLFDNMDSETTEQESEQQ